MRNLVEDIGSKIYARQTTQYFINGCPASGKSYALRQLGSGLSTNLPGLVVFGPYILQMNTSNDYCHWIVNQFLQACFLDDAPEDMTLFQSVADIWDWLSVKIEAQGKKFVVLLDMQADGYPISDQTANFFSALRGLETSDYRRNFELHHILVGYWDHPSLERHYQTINISFPYTIGHNYRHWEGLDVEVVIGLIDSQSNYREIYGRILHELTGGHAGIIQEILQHQGKHDFKLHDVLEIVNNLALSSNTTDRLIKTWRQLPTRSLEVLKQLLIHRNTLVRSSAQQVENHLMTAGLASTKRIGTSQYLYFKSWYAELVARYHYLDLNVSDDKLKKINISDISPEIHALNFEAYRLIRDIETSARNLVAVTLSRLRENDEDLLEGFVKRFDEGRVRDLSDRARELQLRSKIDELVFFNNSILTYITTGELTNLIKEVGDKYDLLGWKNISRAMKNVEAIRNAVMHNHLIDEKSLSKLYELQEKIYSAHQQ